MPAPAVYVLAIVGTVGAVIAFKELVYEPHIAPAIDRWKAEYEAKRRQRESAADVPMTERGRPTGHNRSSKPRTSENGKHSDSEDDDVGDSRGPKNPPGGSTSNLRMSGGLLRRSGSGKVPSPPSKEGQDLELNYLVAREVSEGRSGQDLRLRKNVSSVGHAMDETIHPLPYTPLSPTRPHVVYDPDSPSTPSNASWTPSPAPPTLPLSPPSSGIPKPTRNISINPFEDPQNAIPDHSSSSRARNTPPPRHSSPTSSTLSSSVASASTLSLSSSHSSKIPPDAPVPPPKDTHQPLQTQQGSRPVSPPSQVLPFQPMAPQSLLLGNSVPSANLTPMFDAPPSAPTPTTTSKAQMARLPPLPPSPAQPPPPPTVSGPALDAATRPQIHPYQQHPHNIPSLSQSYPQETDYEHGLELLSPPSSRSESPFSMAGLSPRSGAEGGLRVLSPSDNERGGGSDDGFYAFSPLSEGGRALGSASAGDGAAAGIPVFSPPESLLSSPWMPRPASSLSAHGLPVSASDRNGSFDTLSPLVGHQGLGVDIGLAASTTSRASHATASRTESEYHSFSESEWAEGSSRSSSVMGWHSEDGDGPSNSLRLNIGGPARNVNAALDATATPTRHAFQPPAQVPSQSQSQAQTQGHPQPQLRSQTLTETQILASSFSSVNPYAPPTPPSSSSSPPAAASPPTHAHTDPLSHDHSRALLSPPPIVFRPRTAGDGDADLSDLDFMSDYAVSEGGGDVFSASGGASASASESEAEAEADVEGNESSSDSGWSWTSAGPAGREGARRR